MPLRQKTKRSKPMKKSLIGVLSLIMVVLTTVLCGMTFSGCGTREEDKLYVGLECAYPPFNFTQTSSGSGAVKIEGSEGWANGYDVMIAKRVAEGLGKKLVIRKFDWEGLLPGITSGHLDLVIAGMSPTEKRKQTVDFSDSYYDCSLVIVVRRDGKYASATSLADFSGATLVAQTGTFHDDALKAECADYNITRATPMETFPEMTAALKTKAIDGYVAEDPGARADCAANPELTFVPLKNNDTGFKTGDGDAVIAIGMAKNSPLKDDVNRILAGISAEERLSIMNEAAAIAIGNSDTKAGFFQKVGFILKNHYGWILKGVSYTVLVAIVGTAAGLLIGIAVGVFRTAKTPENKFLKVARKSLDVLLSAYIEIFRGTPMMVQAMVIFWGFALINDGNTMNVTLAGLIIVSVNTGAYMAEIVRGGIISVDKGQFEGAEAIGMTHFQTMTNVVLPQALRNIMPSVANEFVINIKDTSVLNVIGFTELFFYAKSIVFGTYATFETYLIVAVVYFILTFTITRVLRFVEKKMDGKENYRIMGSQNMDAESIVKENRILGGNENV